MPCYWLHDTATPRHSSTDKLARKMSSTAASAQKHVVLGGAVPQLWETQAVMQAFGTELSAQTSQAQVV
jgi:hypothetical protein